MAVVSASSYSYAFSDEIDRESTTLPLNFEPFDLPWGNQRTLGEPHAPGLALPLALKSVSHSDDATPNLLSVVQTIKALQTQGQVLTHTLAKHGALLFRGLPIHCASDFSQFAHAFGYEPHEIIGIVVDRRSLAPNVAPANEAPPHVLIYNHNESPQVPHAPEYVFFYAHKAPARGSGGETPISSSLELYQRAREEMPEFLNELAEKGILSRVVYHVEQQYKGGSTMRQAFGKEIHDDDDENVRRAKIEAQIERYDRGEHTTWKWGEDGKELEVSHRLPVIRTQPHTNLPVLFTNLAALYKNSVVNQASARRNVVQTFGDGSPIPERYLKGLAQITDDIRILHQWEQGDVLVLDNVVAQHGREPWKGEQGDRVVMASLWDGDSVPGAFGSQDWAQVVQARSN